MLESIGKHANKVLLKFFRFSIGFEKSSFIKSSGSIFLATLIGSILLFLSNIILSGFFGPEKYGIYKTTISFFSFVYAFSELGICTTLIKYISEYGKQNEEKISALVQWLLKTRMIVITITVLFLAAFSSMISGFLLKESVANYLVWAGILLTAFIAFETFEKIAIGLQEFKLYSKSKLLALASSAILSIILGYFFGITPAVLGYAFGFFIGATIVAWKIRHIMLRKTKAKIEKGKIFFKFSLPAHILSTPNVLFAAALPILSVFFSQTYIGYYALATTFYLGVTMIATSLGIVLFQRTAKYQGIRKIKEARLLLKKAIIGYLVFAVIASLLFFLIVDWFVKAFLPGYLHGLPVIKPLIVFGLFVETLTIYSHYLNAKSKLLQGSLIVLIKNVLLLLVSYAILQILSSR